MAKNQDKLNLDDIDYDSAFGVETEDAPEDLKLNDEEDQDDDQQQEDVETQDDSKQDDKDSEEEDEQPEEDDSDAEGGKVDDENDDESEVTLVDEIKDLIGFEIDGEFEDTTEGLVELTKTAASKLADDQLNQLFQAMPDVEQYLKYRLDGGDSAQFFETFYGEIDYSAVEVKEDDVSLQERLVRSAMEHKGFDAEDIRTSVEEFKNTGILHSQAEMARKGLAKYQAREKQRLLEEQERQAEENQKQTEAYWKEVNDTIQRSKELRGIPISEKDKKDLLDYVAKPVKNGLSAFQIAMNDAPTDVYLAIAALMKREFDLSGIVSRKATTQNASKLRDRLNSTKKNLKSTGKKGDKVNLKPDFADLDLNL